MAGGNNIAGLARIVAYSEPKFCNLHDPQDGIFTPISKFLVNRLALSGISTVNLIPVLFAKLRKARNQETTCKDPSPLYVCARNLGPHEKKFRSFHEFVQIESIAFVVFFEKSRRSCILPDRHAGLFR